MGHEGCEGSAKSTMPLYPSSKKAKAQGPGRGVKRYWTILKDENLSIFLRFFLWCLGRFEDVEVGDYGVDAE